MTPIERIYSRIAWHERVLEELRSLRDEIEQADLGQRCAARLAANPGTVGKLIERLDSDDLVDATDPPAAVAPKPKRERPKKEPAAGKGERPALRDGPAQDRARRKLAAALADDGPLTTARLADGTGLSRSYVAELVSGHPWFAREHRLKPWELTEAGRAALAERPG